jgi:electron transfer flavoprotein alpha subunit
MIQNILFLAHVDESGKSFPRIAFEVLGASKDAARLANACLAVGIVGGEIQDAANSIARVGARIVGVCGADFAHPRYATDAGAVEAICRTVESDIVIAPATSRFLRVIPGVAQRLGGQVDTHITSLEVADGSVSAKRWFYKQRVEALIRRDARPWFLLVDPGCYEPWSGEAGTAKVETIDIRLAAETKRTILAGIRIPASHAQTIRPDATLLFVAGAGWCKRQSDGSAHVSEAEAAILDFLQNSGASLGGSKSLVDQSGENQSVLRFMTHLNQVGQTGSTPRHPKGLSTCCHGEEPHVVGWRFINERRAINLDPNCGWARGKADVLYVADAFQVIPKLNALLHKK